VHASSAAEKGGLQHGDRIVHFNGEKVTGGEQFRSLVAVAASPVEVAVQRPGKEEPVQLTVPLDGNPVRLGIAWREDDAEPGVVVLVRVTPGSPADRAGLKLSDRVYQIGGRRYQNSEQFMTLAQTLPGPLTMLVERRGRLKMVTVDIPPVAKEAVSEQRSVVSDQ